MQGNAPDDVAIRFLEALRTGSYRRMGAGAYNLTTFKEDTAVPKESRPWFGPLFWIYWEVIFTQMIYYKKYLFVRMSSQEHLITLIMKLID